ncbi:hypothetical protein I6B53_01320 [Schaalia sp. 19OD2882]|uniref:hypothetical protein n=1 Tax=Schaalia sp. 19OD2882 TaxID=2794089 RepID=UPI001C1EC255|nr:hypothetical protein [Schaalia sp. 19OD2882]QWW19803.1 hypothetical protein I6B53_01320 [Schaalia sp. 19OD2882]
MNWRSPAGALLSVLVVAALAFGSWLETVLPSTDDILDKPFEHHARIDDQVEMREVKLRVRSVRAASSVVSEDDDRYRTTGVFLVADVVFMSTRDPVRLSNMQVRTTSGRLYAESVTRNSCGPSQTGVPVRCVVAFEIPERDLAGAKLLIPTPRGDITGGDDLAVIDLGIVDGSALLDREQSGVKLTDATYWEDQ